MKFQLISALTLQDSFDRSVQKLLGNISPGGSLKGTLIASPSTHEPNYYFHWTRDAAICMQSIRDHISIGYFLDYANISSYHQQTPTLSGLGEPKFYVDGRGFDLPWGRPQRDGPALRSVVFMDYLLRNLDIVEIRTWYVPTLPATSLIKRDLEYTAHHWSESSFDLWEEQQGTHFYTLMVQHAAMKLGVVTAKEYGDDGAFIYYEAVQRDIQIMLERFWDRERQQVLATLGSDRLDIAVILACLHSRTLANQEPFFGCSDSKLMITAAKLNNLFVQEYPINYDSDVPLIDRYPGDRYNGVGQGLGNPWILATFSFAEYLYQVGVEFYTKKHFQIDRLNILFFRTTLKMPVQLGSYPVGSCQFQYVLGNLTTIADQYLDRILAYTNDFSEQLHRDIGIPQGARDLSWSYASFITAVTTRKQLLEYRKNLSTQYCGITQ
jgi:glucoamylase